MIVMDAPAAPPPTAMLLATGAQPDWRLFRHGDELLLLERDRPVVRARRVRHTRSPFEARLRARTADGGLLVISWRFGPCRPAPGLPPGGYLATVSYGGRTLSGCYAGSPPGERPILD